MPPKSAEESKRRLVAAAIEVLRTDGIAAMSARAISQRAGVAQGLVFYHFGSVTELIAQACVTATQARVDLHREQFAEAASFADLVALAREVQVAEREAGNVSILGQALAVAQTDAELAVAMRQALDLWREPIVAVSSRLLGAGSPFSGLIDAETFADLLMAAFVGFELTDAVREDGVDDRSFEALEVVAAVLDGLGPVGRRALAATLRRRRTR
ncbi:TetR/AcrR family transcriptional regulator [Aeromicrobium sp. 179-A 4D2 NHS]|uniref:TetR/AcrR family transcriptional regulator n=1 Tax=Aeromicrobium sp. 179-A 4D2 NHS TaxID=3142375 RepID=UPI00399F3C76